MKRKFRRDYDIAVTKREDRFRRELFVFFRHKRIVKIPTGINLSFNGIKTDIDAVMYDKTTKTLGLVQIKWQDPFGHSMKERYSRISNLFPKANEWAEKIKTWVAGNSAKTILNALQITKYAPEAREINEVCIFIITRNQVHFTGVSTDNSIAWSSWYQLIEAMARIKTTFDDPIREMFVKIQMFSADERIKREELPERGGLTVEFDGYSVSYQGKAINE